MASVQTLLFKLPVREELTDEDRTAVREAAILRLWERGKLSTRAATRSLGVSYHEFIDLLAKRGVAAVQADDLSNDAIEAFLREDGAVVE